MSKPIAYWIAGMLFAALVLAKFSPQTGFTSLIRFGESWHERRASVLNDLPISTVPDSSGYDGQFYAQIALDPLLLSPELDKIIDTPAYRARRILVPAIAATLGLGNPWWTLQSYALVNVLCWIGLGWFLSRQIDPREGNAFARWIGCMFSLGVLDSVRQSLVDLPALLLLAMAAEAFRQSRHVATGLWLALASLTKETCLLGAMTLLGYQSLRPFPWRRAGLTLLTALLPLAAWSSYVQFRFPNDTGGGGLGNFTWPFLGLLTQAKHSLWEVALGSYDSRHTFTLIAIPGLLLQAWVLWRSPRLENAWWRIGAGYSILIMFLSPWVWSGYWAACRAVLPMTIAFNLLLPANRSFWILWFLGNLTMLHGVWRFL